MTTSSCTHFARKAVGALIVAFGLVGISTGWRIASGQGPAGLSRSVPFDRLTLTDNSVVEVEPIAPRPLPPVDRKAERKRKENRDPAGDPEEEMMIVHLLDGETRDFKVKRSSIKSVDYFEDMLIADADRKVAAGDFARAFERLLLVRSRDPNWKGLEDAINRLLYAEGKSGPKDGDARRLKLLAELYRRQPGYPGLLETLIDQHSRLIDRALADRQYRQARRLFRDLATVAGPRPEVASIRGRFEAEARARVEAAALASPGARVDILAAAHDIWPDLEGLKARYEAAFADRPTLNVAVDDLARPIGPYPRSPSADRVAYLLYHFLLGSTDDASLRGENPEQLATRIEALELGATLRIGVRANFRWSDGLGSTDAFDVARHLTDQASPESPGYNSRWAHLVDKVEPDGPDRVIVRFLRPTFRPENWLVTPIGPAHAGQDGCVIVDGDRHRPVGNGPLAWASSTDVADLFEAAEVIDQSGPRPKIRRIREVSYPTEDAKLDALRRGEVSLVERVTPRQAIELSRDGEIKVGLYQTPSVHRLAIDGRNVALRRRELRRALSLAIDRRTILEESILTVRSTSKNRTLDAPFVRDSFAASKDVPPLEYNPILAKALVASARKELGGDPIKLTLDYPGTGEARLAVPRIVESLRLIGVEVEPVAWSESALEVALRSGRKFDLAYRSTRPLEPLRDAGPLLVPGYDASPSADPFSSAASARILQLLVQLDRSPEPASARRVAVEIDRESRDELPVIPLWQVEDHYAYRPNLANIGQALDHLYRNVERWEVAPWLGDAP